jgi:hypothetical protein
MVLMMDNKIFNFVNAADKVIASQQILMEKIIPGMLFGKAKPSLLISAGLLRCEFPTQRYVFRVKKNKLGA